MKKEVREGYKMTDLGEIPNKWSVKKLKDVGYSVIGLTYSPDDLVGKEDGILVLRSSNIKNSRISYDDNKYVNKIIAEKQIVKKDDILICSRNGSKELIGKCAIIDEKAEGSSFGAFMTVFRSDYNKYLFHVFNSYLFKRQIYNNIGATINQITTDNLNNFKVIIPTNDEQEKISLILSTIDAQIDNTEKLIQKNQELKKGLMQQLLTKGIENTEFKKTEIGCIPDKWQIKKLRDLADIKRGASPRPINDKKWFSNEKNIGWIRISDVTNTKKYLNATEQYLSEEGKKKSRLVKKNDLIMSICATIGKPIILNMDACIHDGFVLFDNMLNDNVDTEYLFYWLQKKEEEFKGMGQTGTQLNLNTTIVGNTIIALPSLVEQKKIAKILSELDGKLEQYQNKKEKLEELKKGLMQKLLLGTLRVI
ncbi:restriction endonuclease subunit S [Clostridium perfringens]|nr:restriction endonuclease subunit S [Clostridium perfringens]